jgi:hypothetical protein
MELIFNKKLNDPIYSHKLRIWRWWAMDADSFLRTHSGIWHKYTEEGIYPVSRSKSEKLSAIFFKEEFDARQEKLKNSN